MMIRHSGCFRNMYVALTDPNKKFFNNYIWVVSSELRHGFGVEFSSFAKKYMFWGDTFATGSASYNFGQLFVLELWTF